MGTLYLIRHGEISAGSPRRFIGRTDLPLTPKGQEQIERLGACLASSGIEHLVHSPLLRCRQSAEILERFLHLQGKEVNEIGEINLGTWDGCRIEEIKRTFPDDYEERGRELATFRPPGGESFADLLERVKPVFSEYAQPDTPPTALVTHAGVIRVLLCDLLGMPLANLFSIDQGYGCFNIIGVTQAGPRIQGINHAAALQRFEA